MTQILKLPEVMKTTALSRSSIYAFIGKNTFPNPSGRPVGSRNRATLAVQELFEGEAEAISRKAIELALAGDITAIRFIIERILPPCKDTAINMQLPHINNVEDTTGAMTAILQAVASGEITPSEASAVRTGLLKLLDYLQFVASNVLFIKQIDVLNMPVIKYKIINVIIVNFASFINNAVAWFI